MSAHAFTTSLVEFAAAISGVLLIALAVTLLGVRERDVELPAPQPLFAPWPLRGSFIALIVSRAFASGGLYLILPFLAFYLRFALHVGAYLRTSLDLLLVMVFFSVAGTLTAGALGDRLSKKTIIFWSFALLAAGALALAWITRVGPVWPIGILLGCAWGAYYSVDWALACNLLPSGRAGALMAVWNIGASGPQAAAIVVGGLVIDRIGAATGDPGAGYRALFVLIVVLLAAAACALAFVHEPPGRNGGKRPLTSAVESTP